MGEEERRKARDRLDLQHLVRVRRDHIWQPGEEQPKLDLHHNLSNVSSVEPEKTKSIKKVFCCGSVVHNLSFRNLVDCLTNPLNGQRSRDHARRHGEVDPQGIAFVVVQVDTFIA